MMKTRYFAIATAILALASCAQNEEFSGSGNAQSQAISFGQPFVGKTSRAASGDVTGTEDLKNYKVKVWGEKYTGTYEAATDKQSVFTGEPLHWDANATKLDGTDEKGKWVYDSDQRVWEETKNYDFAGFAPADASCTVAYTDGLFKITQVPVTQEIKNATSEQDAKSGEDLLLSATYTSKATAVQRPLVEMTFKHILSRLSVFAYTNLGDGYSVCIDEMSLYLPNPTALASYEQTEHAAADAKTLPAGTWTWNGITNVSNATNVAELGDNYKSYEIVSSSTSLYDGEDYKLSTDLKHNFFLVPTEDVTLYVKVKYTINGLKKNSDGTTTTYDSKQYDKFLPVSALKAFKQGFQHNLYMLISPSSILFNADGVEGWETGKDGNNNFVDGHGRSFMVSGLANDATNHQVTGVIDNYGNLKVGSSDEDITYQLASVANADNSFSKTNQPITILGWYSDEACTGEPAQAPSLINRYAKFAWDYTKTSLEAGTYTFTFKNNMSDKAQTVTLDLTKYVYDPTSNGNGGLNSFEGVDM